MLTVEFNAKMTNGVIPIPDQYQNQIDEGMDLKVIILVKSQANSDTDLIDKSTQNHLGCAKIINMPIIDESKLAELYAEFAEEDSQLAEAGMNEYAILLKEEDLA